MLAPRRVTRGGQSHFRGENAGRCPSIHRAAKIGTVPPPRAGRPNGCRLRPARRCWAWFCSRRWAARAGANTSTTASRSAQTTALLPPPSPSSGSKRAIRWSTRERASFPAGGARSTTPCSEPSSTRPTGRISRSAWRGCGCSKPGRCGASPSANSFPNRRTPSARIRARPPAATGREACRSIVSSTSGRPARDSPGNSTSGDDTAAASKRPTPISTPRFGTTTTPWSCSCRKSPRATSICGRRSGGWNMRGRTWGFSVRV